MAIPEINPRKKTIDYRKLEPHILVPHDSTRRYMRQAQ